MSTTADASNLGTTRESIGLPPPFVVGETYQDHKGEYTVLSVKGNLLEFERADGSRETGDAEIKALIHRNILYPECKRHPLGGARTSYLSNKPVGFSQAEVFPIIASIIERHSKSSNEYMEHEIIVAAELERPELRPHLDQSVAEDREHKPISWWAANMLAWFSKTITDGGSEWGRRFERQKIHRCWAYRVRMR